MFRQQELEAAGRATPTMEKQRAGDVCHTYSQEAESSRRMVVLSTLLSSMPSRISAREWIEYV